MPIDVEKFLTATALVAATTALPACGKKQEPKQEDPKADAADPGKAEDATKVGDPHADEKFPEAPPEPPKAEDPAPADKQDEAGAAEAGEGGGKGDGGEAPAPAVETPNW